jgi:hypothetical protein
MCLPSPEDGNRFSFRNVLSSYLEFWTMDKVHTPSDSECHRKEETKCSVRKEVNLNFKA